MNDVMMMSLDIVHWCYFALHHFIVSEYMGRFLHYIIIG